MSEAAAAISGAGQQGGGDGGQQQGQQGGGDGGQQQAQQGGGDGGQQQQQGAGGDGQQQQQQGDRWQDKFLPDDLKGNEAVGVFKDIPSLAKAFVEQQAWARGRVAIPKLGENPTDADKAAYATAVAEFGAKVRPEKAEDYVIPVPDGQSSATADYFRGKFHEVGLMPPQATALAESWNQYLADEVSAKTQAGKSELTAIELDMGTPAFNQRLTAVGNMLDGMGIEVADLVPALEQMASHHDENGVYQPGAGKAMRALFAMAEKMGELGKVDGVDVQILGGNLSPEQAQAELEKMRGDPNLSTDPAMQKRRNALMRIVADARRPKK